MTIAHIHPAELATTRELDSWTDVLTSVVQLAEQVAGTEFVPKSLRNNVPAVTAAILHGRELGLGPMTSLSVTNVIDGKPTLSAEGQRALALAAGHDIEFLESTGAICTVRGRRSGSGHWTSVTWTIDAARAIGLANKQVWKQYPRAMLAARASAELCRMLFPEVLHGTAATEELEDAAEAPTPAATRPVRRQTRPVASIPPPVVPDAPTRPVDDYRKQWEESTPPPPMPDAPPPLPPDTTPAPPEPVSPAQLKMLGVMWSRFGVTDEERRDLSGRIVGRDLGGTTKNLTRREAHGLITNLADVIRPLADDDDVMSENVDAADARAALDLWLEGRSADE
jgi:hypothetical protein